MVRYENTIGTITKVTSVPSLSGRKLKFVRYYRLSSGLEENRESNSRTPGKLVAFVSNVGVNVVTVRFRVLKKKQKTDLRILESGNIW